MPRYVQLVAPPPRPIGPLPGPGGTHWAGQNTLNFQEPVPSNNLIVNALKDVPGLVAPTTIGSRALRAILGAYRHSNRDDKAKQRVLVNLIFFLQLLLLFSGFLPFRGLPSHYWDIVLAQILDSWDLGITSETLAPKHMKKLLEEIFVWAKDFDLKVKTGKLNPVEPVKDDNNPLPYLFYTLLKEARHLIHVNHGLLLIPLSRGEDLRRFDAVYCVWLASRVLQWEEALQTPATTILDHILLRERKLSPDIENKTPRGIEAYLKVYALKMKLSPDPMNSSIPGNAGPAAQKTAIDKKHDDKTVEKAGTATNLNANGGNESCTLDAKGARRRMHREIKKFEEMLEAIESRRRI